LRLSRARWFRYPHADLGFLSRGAGRVRCKDETIVTDGVFSMDGDMAPLPGMLDLVERYDAWLLIDDAHGFA